MSAAPLKILVVNDEPHIRKLLRMGLSTQGYEILEAPTGKATLDLLACNPGVASLPERPLKSKNFSRRERFLDPATRDVLRG